MKDFRKGRAYPLLLALAAAGLLTCLAWAGLLDGADRTASDAWYRDFQTTEGDVVLVGIDQRALEEIGPYEEWGRDIMAMAVEYLNESEDCHPAAIALDVLYIGERDPDADAWPSSRTPSWSRRAADFTGTGSPSPLLRSPMRPSGKW